jgi:two-component system NtrC family sensor kinase
VFNRDGQLRYSTDPQEPRNVAHEEVCKACHTGGGVSENPTPKSRVRYATSPKGALTLNIVTPIFNEPSCAKAACHAHPAKIKVLGVVDVGLGLSPVEQQTRAMTLQAILSTAMVVVIGAAFVILFTRRFVATPIRELIEGTKAVSKMNLDCPIEIEHRSQEIDELVESFNVMRERLKFAIAELNEMTQTLESKVAERTTQLQAAHRKLLHTDRLASLGQLAASVAHEINNPISGVLNLSMLLERFMGNGQFPAGREEEFRKHLNRISTETGRVGRIVSDLLAFSRRSKPQRAPADLNRLIRSTLALVGHKLQLSNTETSLELAENLPAVECGTSQIQQVILNLVMNGSEAMQAKHGGRLTICTKQLAGGQAVELSVQDTGEGIAPENLPKIFDPFFTTKAEGKGVGLGLAVLYGIVQAHDGEVDVTSRRNEGTTFTVTLPLKPGSAPAQPGEVRDHAA